MRVQPKARNLAAETASFADSKECVLRTLGNVCKDNTSMLVHSRVWRCGGQNASTALCRASSMLPLSSTLDLLPVELRLTFELGAAFPVSLVISSLRRLAFRSLRTLVTLSLRRLAFRSLRTLMIRSLRTSVMRPLSTSMAQLPLTSLLSVPAPICLVVSRISRGFSTQP